MFINIVDGINLSNVVEFIINAIVPLLSALAGGAMAFWGTHWKTKQEMKEKRKDERRKDAASISKTMASLQITATRDTTIPFSPSKSEQKRCREDIGKSYELALFTLCQYRYCLPDKVSDDIQMFLDATYQNIRHWQARLDFLNNPDDEILKLNNDEACRYELPHKDQAEGDAYNAFVKMNKSLRDYVDGVNNCHGK